MEKNDYFENRPVTLNGKNNLLEIEEHMYTLQDVEKPNTFRNMFPYEEIPKIPLMTELFLTICQRTSGSQIRHFVMDSSPEHLIPQSRSLRSMTICTN